MSIHKINHFLKYTGSKRNLAPEILKYFPTKIDIMIEPFCGSAALTLTMIANNWDVGKYIVSDSNIDIVDLLRLCKHDPDWLAEVYSEYHESFNIFSSEENCVSQRKHVFNLYRKMFNQNRRPEFFFCVIRTCTNGLIRFNRKGEFNTSCHFTRPGIEPVQLAKQIKQCSEWLQQVDIRHQPYTAYKPNAGFFFLDPPYIDSGTMYSGQFDHQDFFKWLKGIPDFRLTMDEGLDIDGLEYRDLASANTSHTRVNHGTQRMVSERLFYRG